MRSSSLGSEWWGEGEGPFLTVRVSLREFLCSRSAHTLNNIPVVCLSRAERLLEPLEPRSERFIDSRRRLEQTAARLRRRGGGPHRAELVVCVREESKDCEVAEQA